MNTQRRQRIEAALAVLRTAAEEEREAFDNLHENFQCSERGTQMETIADALDQAIDDIEGALP